MANRPRFVRRIRVTTVVLCFLRRAIRAAKKAVAVNRRMVLGKYHMRHLGTLYNFVIPSEIGSDHCCSHIDIDYNNSLLTHLLYFIIMVKVQTENV